MATIFSSNFDTFAGTGFAPAPAAGQLDSDIFRVVGFSDSIAYGGTANSGDLARGFAGADAVTEGVYSSTNGADRALIVQPDADEFVNGGYIEAKIQNTSGSAASQFDVAFHWAHRNNQAGTTNLAFSYSTDGVNFTTVPAGAFTTPGATDALGFVETNRIASFTTGSAVANGGFLFLRWTDLSSTGAGFDEVGIDDLVVSTAPGTRLSAGDVAIVGYNTDVDTTESLSFVVLKDIAAGTEIHFTDRAWNGTTGTFAAASAGEGTFTYTAGAPVTAGTVITITDAQLNAAGIELSLNGETVYAYQGDASTPARFLYAADIADGNATFNGSLTNTGLTAGTNAVAVSFDNAVYAGPNNHGAAFQLSQNTNLLTDISTSDQWVGANNTGQAAYVQPAQSNFQAAPDQQVWIAASGGGNAIVHIDRDATVGGGNTAYNLLQLYQNSFNISTFHPTDIVLDTVHDKYFIADSDGTNDRIIQGSISQALADPGATPTFTVLYSEPAVNDGDGFVAIELDIANQRVYFAGDTKLYRVNYNTANQAPTVVSDLGAGVFTQDMVLDLDDNRAFITNHQTFSLFGADTLDRNFIYSVNLTTGVATQLPMSPNDQTVGPDPNPNADPDAFPGEKGAIAGIDIDPVNDILYFTTQSVSLNNVSYLGGVYSYNLNGNPTGTYTNLFQQDGTNGPRGLLWYIDVDTNTGRYFVSDRTGGPGNTVGDEGVWRGSTAGGTPTLFALVNNVNGLAPLGITTDTAPAFTASSAATPTVTEVVATSSGFTTAVQPILSANLTDFDTASQTDQLAGAIVRISANFLSGATHQDRLTINGTTSGTLDFGSQDITYNYNSTTGAMTLSGASTFDNYEAALALVRYDVSGDNPTDFGTKGSRTIAWSVSDGLLSSDEQSTTVTVVGTNDAPVNNGVAAKVGDEDAFIPITGLSITDVDADPASQDITVTFTVTNGTLTIATNVLNGVEASDITGGANGSTTVTITATQNQINATLAAANGLRYLGNANYNGTDTLTITTNDQGFNGNDPGLTGSGGNEQDTDQLTITINPVNDPVTSSAPASATLDEDTSVAISGLSIADVDTALAPNGVYVVTLTATNGTLTLTTLSGLTFSAGDGTSDATMTFRGTLANLNTALATASYTPTPDFNGAATVTINVTDEFGGTVATGSGAATSDTDVVNVTVNAVNDPIGTVAPGAVSLAEDAVDFAVTGMSITDVDAALAPNGVYEVTLSATQGALTLTTLTGLTFTAGDGTSDATMTFHGTLSAINTALGTAKYTPPANYNGAAQISFQATDTFGGTVATGSGAATSDGNTINVTVNAANDPVTGAAPANLSLTEDDPATAITGLSIADVDTALAPNGVYSVTLSASHGALTLSTTTGLTFDAGDGSGDATMTFHGTLSDINTALATATYTPTADYNGSDTIVFAVTDTFGGVVATGSGAATSDSDNIAVTVSAVNDPVTSNAPTTATIPEDVPTVITGLSIADVDATVPSGTAGVYEVTLGATQGTLTLTTLTGLTFTAGDGTADGTMTFHGTLSDINAALATATYTGNSNYNGPAQVTINVTDTFGGVVATGTGAATSDGDTINVTVSSVNDAPAGTDATKTINEDATYTFAAADFGFSDAVENNAFFAVKIGTITNGSLTNNGVAVASGDTVPVGAITAGLLVFTPAANVNGAGAASFTFQVQDDGGTANGGADLDPTANTFAFDITAVSDAPAGTDTTVNGLQNQDYTFTVADFGFTDPNDTPANAFTAVTITTLPATGTLTLNGVAVTAGQSVSTTDIAGNLLKFTPVTNTSGAAYTTFTFQVQDDGGTANGGADLDPSANTITVNVDQVNIAPAGTDKTVTTNEDVPVVFTAADFGFSDTDGNTLAAVKVATLPAAGSLTNNGVAVNAGDFVSIADINAGRLQYTPALNASGDDYASFTFQVQDNGGTGNGGIDLDQSANTITVDVNASNDAPAGTDVTKTLAEDGSYTLAAADFGFSDAVEGNAFTAVTITTLPTAGTLTLNGTAVTAGQSVSATDIGNNLLVFTPAANANGSGYASFTFQVQDDGGTANGGVGLDQTPNTVTFDVTAVNDAPAGTDAAKTILEGGSYTFATADFGFSDASDSPANALLAVKITTLPGAGTLTNNGVAVNPGDSVSATDIGSGLLVFTPAANGSGAPYATFTFQVQDNGGTAGGGVDLDPSANSFAINVTGINDEPAGTDKTVAAVEDTAYAFTVADFGLSDPLDGNALLAVRIATLPGAGTLTNDGVAVAAGDFVSAADIAAGKLQFKAAVNASGAAYASFTFQVQDDGGTANGGVDLDQTPNTITVDVAAASDAPTDITGGPFSVVENSAAGTVVGTVAGVEPEGQAVTYSLIDNAGGRFAINSTTGQITVLNGVLLDFEQTAGHAITVRVTDPDTLFFDKVFTIGVTDQSPDVAIGGASDDTLVGGATDDLLAGNGANDVLIGGAGDDQINGGAGNDNLAGGIANDVMIGGLGNDFMDGGADNDYLAGGIGNDLLFGGDGNDQLEGGDENDYLVGGIGNDVLLGGDGNDQLEGGEGNDFLAGGLGADVLLGGDGNNQLEGGDGNDFVAGGAGNDAVIGGEGNDQLDGGVGNDYVEGGIGNDVLLGGDGNDYLTGGEGSDYLIGGIGADFLTGGAAADSFYFASPSEGQDVIADFVRAQGDHILLSSAGFGMSSLANGVNFFSGTAPAPGSAAPTLLYDTTSGLLSYDADGSGGGAAVGIVAVAGAPSLQTSDILLV